MRRWAAVAFALAFAGSCDKEATAPTDPLEPPASQPQQDTVVGLSVSLSIRPDTIVPGESAVVTAEARIPGDKRLDFFVLNLRGMGSDTTILFPIIGKGSKTFAIEISIENVPVQGVLYFKTFARMGAESDSAEATLTIRDDGPPRLVLTAPDTIATPMDLVLHYSAEDAAGIVGVAFNVRGAVTLDTVLSHYEASVSGALTVAVPATAPPGDSVSFRATALDGFGKSAVQQRVVWLSDSTAPTVSVEIDTVFHSGFDDTPYGLIYFAGDTVRVRVAASDNHSLSRLGCRMLSYGDSTSTADNSSTLELQFELPAGTNEPEAPIEVFAIDSSGNMTALSFQAAVMDGRVRPMDFIDHTARDFGSMDEYFKYVLDVEEDQLYYTRFDYSIHRLPLSPLTAPSYIDFATTVRAVSRLPGTDSLVALVVGTPDQFVVWDRRDGWTTRHTVPFDLPGDCQAFTMEVAENGKALVSGASPSAGWSHDPCPPVEVDVRTGEVRSLDIPVTVPYLDAPEDQSRIVAWNLEVAVIYDPSDGSVSPVRELFPSLNTTSISNPGPTFSEAGDRVLIRNKLFNADLTEFRWLLPDPAWPTPASAFSADGQFAFMGYWPGYWKVDVATGAVLEKVMLPRWPGQIVAHPDGRRLIVSGWMWIGVIDLR